ncbi:MAG TPA: response regulator [Polyangiaceae bacterium]
MAKTIMIVDDSTSMRQVLGHTLRVAGYEVVEGCDGRDALAKLTGQRVHLIISDVNMPHLDGIGLLKAVKLIPEYKFIPFIMLTTESQHEQRQAGQMAGARAWVVKPFEPDKLLSAVAKLVPP